MAAAKPRSKPISQAFPPSISISFSHQHRAARLRRPILTAPAPAPSMPKRQASRHLDPMLSASPALQDREPSLLRETSPLAPTAQSTRDLKILMTTALPPTRRNL